MGRHLVLQCDKHDMCVNPSDPDRLSKANGCGANVKREGGRNLST